MARATLTIFDLYHTATLNLDDGSWSGTKTKASYVDTSSGDKLVLEGKNLKYDNGLLDGGTVTGLSIVDADGGKAYTIEDIRLGSRLFSGDDFLSHFEDILGKIFSKDTRYVLSNHNDSMIGQEGRDIIRGRGGDDLLGGGGGKDILTGGGGVDTFVFYEGWGKDVITDFDVDESDGKRDLLQIELVDVESITRSGKDTIIDLGHGDTLTVLNVRPNQLEFIGDIM